MSEALDLLAKSEALLEGHFRLSSGLHSNRYFQCARAFVDTAVGRRLVEMLVPKLPKVDMVVGPAMGGIIVAYEIASQLGAKNCFTEREGGQMTLRRGFSIPPDTSILIAEDVVTT
ncbi:MAG: type I phosphoribosyltransferase, partial [Candidatus Xenobia bacterium]